MDWIETEGGPLRVEETGAGKGTPLLLLHGGGADRSHWDRLVPLLAEGRRVVTFDQRGFGETPPPKAGERSLRTLAADAVSVAERLVLGRPVLIGHSFGGSVVAEAVGQWPDRFAGAVFLDAAGDLRGIPREAVDKLWADLQPATFRASSRAWFEQLLTGARPDTRVHVLSTLGLTAREDYLAAFQMLLQFDPASAIRRFPGPKLLVTVPGHESPTSLPALLPDLPNEIVDDSSHWLQLDQPERVAAVVLDFLARRVD